LSKSEVNSGRLEGPPYKGRLGSDWSVDYGSGDRGGLSWHPVPVSAERAAFHS